MKRLFIKAYKIFIKCVNYYYYLIINFSLQNTYFIKIDSLSACNNSKYKKRGYPKTSITSTFRITSPLLHLLQLLILYLQLLNPLTSFLTITQCLGLNLLRFFNARHNRLPSRFNRLDFYTWITRLTCDID